MKNKSIRGFFNKNVFIELRKQIRQEGKSVSACNI